MAVVKFIRVDEGPGGGGGPVIGDPPPSGSNPDTTATWANLLREAKIVEAAAERVVSIAEMMSRRPGR
jgi:hypothetical protein